jgi:hypothetical protein
MIKNIHLVDYCFKFGSTRAKIKTTWKYFETWRLLSYRMWSGISLLFRTKVLPASPLKMEAARSPKTLIKMYQTQGHRCKNLKSHIFIVYISLHLHGEVSTKDCTMIFATYRKFCK